MRVLVSLQPLALLVVVAAAVAAAGEVLPVRLSAWNVQVLGTSKMADHGAELGRAVQALAADVLLIQEIRDASLATPAAFEAAVNNAGARQYDVVASPRLGRTSSQEQYAWLVARGSGSGSGGSGVRLPTTAADCAVFPDPQDVFEREPWVCAFFLRGDSSSSSSSAGDSKPAFVVAALHARPDDVEAELNALPAVVTWARTGADAPAALKHEGVPFLVAGDLNADCSYLSQTRFNGLTITRDGWHWLTDSDANTTLAASSCAYDRFILAPEPDDARSELGIAEGTPTAVFHYDTALGLSSTAAQELSDHYPISLELELAPTESSAAFLRATTAPTLLALGLITLLAPGLLY